MPRRRTYRWLDDDSRASFRILQCFTKHSLGEYDVGHWVWRVIGLLLHRTYFENSIIELVLLIGPTDMVMAVVAIVFGFYGRFFDGVWDCATLLLWYLKILWACAGFLVFSFPTSLEESCPRSCQ